MIIKTCKIKNTAFTNFSTVGGVSFFFLLFIQKQHHISSFMCGNNSIQKSQMSKLKQRLGKLGVVLLNIFTSV